MTQPWSSGNAWSPRDQFCLSRNTFSCCYHLHDVKLFIVKKTQSLDENQKNRAPQHAPTSHKVHCMNLSFFSFYLMTVFFWRWITSHYGDDDSMKKYFDWGKTDLWGFMRFLDTKHATIISNFRDQTFRGVWCSECISLQRNVNKVRALRASNSSEGFVSKSARLYQDGW